MMHGHEGRAEVSESVCVCEGWITWEVPEREPGRRPWSPTF